MNDINKIQAATFNSTDMGTSLSTTPYSQHVSRNVISDQSQVLARNLIGDLTKDFIREFTNEL